MSQLKKFFLHVIVYLVVFITMFKVLNMESSFWTIFLSTLLASGISIWGIDKLFEEK